jgi:hypothetical protein
MLVLVVATIPLRRMLTVLLGVAISSLIILATVRNQIPRMFEWFASIGLSSGRHGGSSDTSLVVNAITSVNSLSGFLPGFRLIVLSLFLSLSVFAVLARKSHVELRPLVATAVALVTVVLLTVKQSEPRDLVTIVPIMGLAVSWLVFALTQRIGGRWGIVAGSSIVVLFIGAVGLSVLRYGLFMNTTSQVVSAKVVDAEQLENSMSDGTWALGYNVWTQSNSLLFGANDAVMFGVDQSDPLGDREIGNAYPGALHFDHWNGDIRGIDSSGRLADLSCVEVKQLVDGRGLSLAVESEAHLMVKSSAEGLELAGGVGTLSPIGKVGGYLTYRLMNISCN